MNVQNFITRLFGKKRFALFVSTALLVALPITVFVAQQQQQLRQNAAENLAAITVSPTTVNAGQTVTVSWNITPPTPTPTTPAPTPTEIPTPTPRACNVAQSLTLLQPGVMRVDVSGGLDISNIAFSSTPGVTVDINGQTGLSGAFTQNFTAGTTNFSFVLNEITACTAGTAFYIINDSCGPISKFAGSGAQGWGTCPTPTPTNIPTPTPLSLTITATAVCSGTTSQIDVNFTNVSGHIYMINASPGNLLPGQIPGPLTNRPLRVPFGSGADTLIPGNIYNISVTDVTASITSNTVDVTAISCSGGAVKQELPFASNFSLVPKAFAQTLFDGTETLQLYSAEATPRPIGQRIFLNCSPFTPPTSPQFTGVCPYDIQQTVPPGSYILRMVAADDITILGDSAPFTVIGTQEPSITPTIIPTFQLDFDFLLNGIVPTTNSNPDRKQRTFTTTFFDVTNQPIATKSAILQYSTESARFTGQVAFPANIPAGNYIIKIFTPQYLTKRIPGIFSFSPNITSYILPPITLVGSDANNDNKIDSLDYNFIYQCYGERANQQQCTDKTAADFDDNGTVNGIDYNIFIRNLAVQKGD